MNILDRILENKRWENAKRKENYPISFLEKQNRNQPHTSLFKAISTSKFSLICEFKRRSPSSGIINTDLSPDESVIRYTNFGAAGISVLTDKKYFDGSLKDLARAKYSTHIPILRKDFIIDDYQLTEAWKAGADAVLLIADILDLATLTNFYHKAKDIGLEVLVEVHSVKHAFKLNSFKPEMVGVNCRDLNTMTTNLNWFEKMRSLLPSNTICVAESGISTKADINFVSSLGYNAALIGSSIMQDSSLLNELLG